jgi:hypothetical protein
VVSVGLTARLENIQRDGDRPLQALSEAIEITVGGQRVKLELNRGRPRASRTLLLPEGEHAWQISARARAKGFPGNGGFPCYVDLEGESSGRVTVRQGVAIVYRRGDADGNLYSVRLVAAK